MLRSLLILSVLIASSYTVSGQYSNDRRYFDDFKGQKFCATRYTQGQCCANRVDECSVPIAGTLCYCDEFCDQHINPDCCPDYAPVCKGEHPPNELRIFKDNCNLCSIFENGTTVCENKTCLMEPDVISGVNRDAYRLGWKAKNYTEFYGRELKEGLTLRLGTFEPRVRVKSMSRLGHNVEDLPRKFNALEQYVSLISEIRDQGWCGSSWAVSTASVSSDRLGISTKEVIDLSSQHLLSCVRHQQGCIGGHLDNAWRLINKLGVADETCYPYETKVGECRARKGDNLRTLQCTTRADGKDDFYKMGPAYSLNNETDIMWEIFHYGPVQATMWVYPDFFTYNTGIYRKSSFGDQRAKGFHSVRLVGWGEESNGRQSEKFWYAANSWGTWWGERGYFRILRGANECGIEDYVLAAIADHDRKINNRPVRRSNRRASRKSN